MDKRTREQVKAFKVMEGQIALLQTGARAADYACREVLNLALNCTVEEIAESLHRKLHHWKKMSDDAVSEGWLLAYTTAAKQLLTGLVKR